ncbi:unnamed protein product [Microthlaspi erraticum]|uniref:Uncharacterized protein n=1 Tax=Microthlaspi erraticum TaxID=1685480 RepID=A0A6D2K0H1_9BRAS|nr:unnamed protein product [Microthlaspi erraticum]
MPNQGENRSRGSQSGQDVSQSGNASNTSDDTYMPSKEEGSWYEFLHGYMPESANDSDSTNYWHYGPWEVPIQPYYSSSESTEAPSDHEHHNATPRQSPNGVSNGHPQPNPTAEQQTIGADNSQGSRSAGQPNPNGQQPLDPTLTMVHNLLSQVLHQGASNGTPPPPDFLKCVTMMKTLGTYRFEGSYDPDEADTWMSYGCNMMSNRVQEGCSSLLLGEGSTRMVEQRR